MSDTSAKALAGGCLVTVIGGVITAYIVGEGRFAVDGDRAADDSASESREANQQGNGVPTVDKRLGELLPPHGVEPRFTQVDRAIFQALVRWTKRRHPGISLQRLWPQYFRRRENRASVFFAETRKPNGTLSYLDLFEASSLRITRHIKVRGEATAFDPEHQDYFRLRRVVQKRADERGLLGFGQDASRNPQPRQSQPGRVKAAPGRA